MGNLISLADRPPEERQRIARMGAAASAESRRRIKKHREDRELFFKCADSVATGEIINYLERRIGFLLSFNYDKPYRQDSDEILRTVMAELYGTR